MRNFKMVKEAVLRMERIGLYDVSRSNEKSIIEMFVDEGLLFVSRPGMGNRAGVLSPIKVAEQKLVDEFENEYGALVYHVIRNEFEIGVCYTFLYVSKDENEWAMDRNDLEGIDPGIFIGRANVRAYAVNVGYITEDATELKGVGEFVSVGIENGSGGIIRKA